MKRFFKCLFWIGLAVFYFLKIRPSLLFKGAKGDEADRALPGDFIIGDKSSSTRALTIFVKPENIWPWLAQMGRGAGYYTYDCCLNGGKQSADYLLEDLPVPKAGDKNNQIGEVEDVVTGQAIVWIKRDQQLPGAVLDSRLTYAIVPRGEYSRLLVRQTIDWRGPLGFIYSLGFELVHYYVIKKQMWTLKHTIETYDKRLMTQIINRHRSEGHQGDIPKFK